MLGFKAGSAYVSIRPDLRGFHKDIKRELGGVDKEFASIAKRLQSEMSDTSATMKVKADTSDATRGIATVSAEAARLDGKNVKVNVDTRGASQAAGLMQQTSLTMGQMVVAAGALGSALIPVAAAAGGVAAALAAPLAAAGGGLTLFGIIAGVAVKQTKDQIKEIGELQDKMSEAKAAIAGTKGASRKSALAEAAEATKAYHAALNDLSPAQTRFMTAQTRLKDAFHDLVQTVGPAIFGPLVKGMNLITRLMPAVQPVLRAVSGAFTTLLGEVDRLAHGPALRGFMDFFAKQGRAAIVSFGHIAFNVALGIGGLIKAFAPLGTSVLGAIENLSYQMLNLGSSKGVRSFIDYAKKWMPVVAAVFADLFLAGVHLVKALAPLGGFVLKGLGLLAHLIRKIPVDVLTTVIGTILGAVGAFKALQLVMAINPTTLWIAGIVALVAALIYAYKHSEKFRNIVNAAWAGIKKAVSAAWNNVIKPVFHALSGFITGTLIPVIRFLWTHVVKPVFRAIGDAIQLWWNYYAKPVFTSWKTVLTRVVFPVLQHLWAGVVKPIFRLIGDQIRVTWAVIRIIFALWKAYFTRVLFPTIRFLWDKVVKPVFGWIGDKITTVWNKNIKPVFQTLGEFIHKHIAPAFRKGVEAIGNAWDSLKAAAARPVNFVIETVYNNGIRKFVNGLLDKFDIGGKGARLPFVQPLGAKMTGGQQRRLGGTLNEFAAGGVLPGYTPRRDVHQFVSPTGGRLNLSGGEAFMVPEFTKAVGPKQILRWNKIARKRGVPALQHEMGMAAGGIFNNLSGRTSMDGEPLSRIHAAQIALAERLSGMAMRVMQGSWQAPSSYSGTSHTGSGVADTSPGSFHAQRWLRKVGIAAWARNIPGAHSAGSGAHVHGVSRLDPAARGNSQLAQFAAGGDGLGGSDYGPNPPTLPNLFSMLAQFKNLSLAQGSSGGFMSKIVSKVVGWVADKGKKLLGNIPGSGSTFGKIAAGVGGRVVDSIANWITAKFGGGAGGGFSGKAVGSAQKFAKGLLSNFGWGGGQFGPLKALWNKESGWRWNADNPSSSAYGIPQALPGSKMASAGADWRTNPATQIKWGLGYIKGRYGSPAGAWAHSQNVGWYKNGGWLKPGHTAVNETKKPEPVFSAAQWQILKKAITSITLNQGRPITQHWLTDVLDKTAKSVEQLRREFIRTRDALRPFRVRTERSRRRLDRIRESDRFQDRAQEARRAERAFKAARSGEAIGADVHETRRDARRALRRARRSPIGRDALRDFHKAQRDLNKARDADQVEAAQKRARWRKQEARERLRSERAPIIQARAALRKARQQTENADSKEARRRARQRAHEARQELHHARQQPDSARKSQAREEIKRTNRRLNTLGKEAKHIEHLTKVRDHAGQQSGAVKELVRSRKRLENLRDERKERRQLRREARRAGNADILQRETKAQERLNARIKAERRARDEAKQAAQAYRKAQDAARERARGVRESAMGLGSIDNAPWQTSGGILYNLRRAVMSVKAWTGIVKQLRSAGLKGPIMEQFIAAGPSEESVRLGRSLLAGGQIKEINSMQAELAQASIGAGAAGGLPVDAVRTAATVTKPKPKPAPKPKPRAVVHPQKPKRPGVHRAPRVTHPEKPHAGAQGGAHVHYHGMPADTVETIVSKTVARMNHQMAKARK